MTHVHALELLIVSSVDSILHGMEITVCTSCYVCMVYIWNMISPGKWKCEDSVSCAGINNNELCRYFTWNGIHLLWHTWLHNVLINTYFFKYFRVVKTHFHALELLSIRSIDIMHLTRYCTGVAQTQSYLQLAYLYICIAYRR